LNASNKPHLKILGKRLRVLDLAKEIRFTLLATGAVGEKIGKARQLNIS
jgi:hypothetical protein